MSTTAAHEFWSVFHARRVKAPDLRGPDLLVSSAVGWVKNRKRVLARLRRQAQRIERLEPEIHALSTAKINEEVEFGRVLARLNRLKGDALDRSMGVGHITHETTPEERIDHYRRDVVYCTQKELVADFLRDQIALGTLRSSAQTSLTMLRGLNAGRLLVPGLFRVIVDEADSVLIDEAVTPLIISNSPDDEPNADRYRKADELCQQLRTGRDFKIDWTVRQVDLTPTGEERLEELSGTDGFWRGKRRREELVTQALTARHCFIRDEQYLVDDEGKVAIIDEFTGRVMADRSWRHGLHQAIEVKEAVKVTADKENLARISFQRFFRQYPILSGSTGTAWEATGQVWQHYCRPLGRGPTH